MDVGVWIGLISVVAGCAVLGIGYAGAWALGRARGRRDALEEGFHGSSAERRLASLEETMEQIASQMHQLAESQRFTVGLLAERVKGDGAPKP